MVPFNPTAEKRTCWNSCPSWKPSPVEAVSSNVTLYVPRFLALAPKIHIAVPLKVRLAEAAYCVVNMNVTLSSRLNVSIREGQVVEIEREHSVTHDCQEGSGGVRPEAHAPAGEQSIRGLTPSKVTFTF